MGREGGRSVWVGESTMLGCASGTMWEKCVSGRGREGAGGLDFAYMCKSGECLLRGWGMCVCAFALDKISICIVCLQVHIF